MSSTAKRVLLALAYLIPPIFAALFAGATTVNFGRFYPWASDMVDLEVYQRAVKTMIAGGDFYAKPVDWPDSEMYLPFIYPPFAALLMAPLALIDKVPAELLWLVVNALAMVGVAYRFGLRGWKLSASSAALIWLVEPVRMTLGFGQVNIFLMALVAFDLAPGERFFKRQLLPQGVLTGIATGIKLTPALFAVYFFLSGKVKPAIVTFLSFVATVVIGFLAMPQLSTLFWTRLIHGDSGINAGLKYFNNQSVVGAWIRIVNHKEDTIPKTALVLAFGIIVLGLVAAVLWHRLGEQGLAVCLTGLTTLLASPISWSHHFVWVVPLLLVLLTNQALPNGLRYVGLLTCTWIAYAPFTYAFHVTGTNEFKFSKVEDLIAAGNVLLGVTLLLTAIGYALYLRRQQGLPWLPLTLKEQEIVTPEAAEAETGE